MPPYCTAPSIVPPPPPFPAVLQRIDIPGIFRHPWFLQELPEGAATMNAWYLQHAPDLGQASEGCGGQGVTAGRGGRLAGWLAGWQDVRAGRGHLRHQQEWHSKWGAQRAQMDRNPSECGVLLLLCLQYVGAVGHMIERAMAVGLPGEQVQALSFAAAGASGGGGGSGGGGPPGG